MGRLRKESPKDLPAPVAKVRLRVVPNAKRSEIAGLLGESIKVKVGAPAIDGKANEALFEFLSEVLQVPVCSLGFAAGDKSRDKTIQVDGLTYEEATRRLLKYGLQ